MLGVLSKKMKLRHQLMILLGLVFVLAGCGSEGQPLEVTRIITQEVPIITEVTREVAMAVPVEVTRLVEVVATATALPLVAETAVPAPESQEAATAAAEVETDTAVSNIYTVQAGDNLSLIAAKTGIAIADILAVNNLTSSSILTVGQQLTMPGWDGQIAANAAPALANNPVAPAETPAEAAAEPPSAAVPVGANLLPNPSFEGDWYFFNGVQEWQISEGWALAVDEGPNPLTEADDLFIRPEVRVVSKANLPAKEHNLFVFDGNKTIKIFKGGAPVHFAVFSDLQLPAGSYRFTINFFADTVSIYDQGNKVWATHPQAAEVRFVLNDGGSDWLYAAPGQKNSQTFDFTLAEPTAVRLGADFRNRFVNTNNGWFLDNWSLQQLSTP